MFSFFFQQRTSVEIASNQISSFPQSFGQIILLTHGSFPLDIEEQEKRVSKANITLLSFCQFLDFCDLNKCKLHMLSSYFSLPPVTDLHLRRRHAAQLETESLQHIYRTRTREMNKEYSLVDISFGAGTDNLIKLQV